MCKDNDYDLDLYKRIDAAKFKFLREMTEEFVREVKQANKDFNMLSRQYTLFRDKKVAEEQLEKLFCRTLYFGDCLGPAATGFLSWKEIFPEQVKQKEQVEQTSEQKEQVEQTSEQKEQVKQTSQQKEQVEQTSQQDHHLFGHMSDERLYYLQTLEQPDDIDDWINWEIGRLENK